MEGGGHRWPLSPPPGSLIRPDLLMGRCAPHPPLRPKVGQGSHPLVNAILWRGGLPLLVCLTSGGIYHGLGWVGTPPPLWPKFRQGFPPLVHVLRLGGGGVYLRRGARPVVGCILKGRNIFSQWFSPIGCGGGVRVTTLQDSLCPCTCRSRTPLSSPVLDSYVDSTPSPCNQNLSRVPPLWERSCSGGRVSLHGRA